MTARKDMTPAEYRSKMESYGFVQGGWAEGYWKLPGHLNCVHVSDVNAGSNRRNKLAYMLEAVNRHQEQYEAEMLEKEQVKTMTDYIFGAVQGYSPDQLKPSSFKIGKFLIRVSVPREEKK